MKLYRVTIVEDNQDDLDLLLDFVNRVPFLAVAGSFSNPLTALAFLSTEPVDLLLLDLQMPGLSGYDLLRSLVRPPAVILTTSSLADSLEAFDLGVIDYLVKPIRYERFLRSVNRVLARHSAQPAAQTHPAVVTLKQGNESIRVPLEAITHLEAFGAQTKVYLTTSLPIVANQLLAALHNELPADQFIRIHRSFVVALTHVGLFSNRQVVVQNHTIPVGRMYQDAFMRVLGGR